MRRKEPLLVSAFFLIVVMNVFAVPSHDWRVMSKDEMPSAVSADFAVVGRNTMAAFSSARGDIMLYSVANDSMKPRSVVSCAARKGAVFELDRTGAGITVRLNDNTNKRVFDTCFLPKSDIMVFRSGTETTLHIRDVDIRYGIIPSLIGVDLVYDPAKYKDKNALHIPSMNMFTGLMAGNDAMMVAAWDKGDQHLKLGLADNNGGKLIDSMSVYMGDKNFYLAYIEHPNIWHAEKLKDAYLETDTEITWKRPFDARWIGRIYLDEAGFSYPFYFQPERRKIWGRYISGRYIMPCWFEGNRTMLHFEKKFPPIGDALIYYLDDYGDRVVSPFDIMRRALGAEKAYAILDWEGVPQSVLLEHRKAVCAMLRNIQKDGTPYYDDIVTFVDLIRKRIHTLLAYSKDMRDFLQKQNNPKVAPSLVPILETAGKMQELKQRIPRESPDQVREWTRQLKLVRESKPFNNKRFKTLDNHCRRVAGTQDDLAKDLSWLAINIMEQAAEFAAESRDQCDLAEEIIGKTREVLRNGSWWEPARFYLPRSNPGAPVKESEL